MLLHQKTADLATGDIVIATNGSSFFFDGTKWKGIGTEGICSKS